MSITATSSNPGKAGFIVNATSADASGCEQIIAAPDAGTSIYIDQLTINNGADAISITIGAGETSPAVTAIILGPVAMAANTTAYFDFRGIGGIKLAAATALTLDASGSGAVCIVVQGRIE